MAWVDTLVSEQSSASSSVFISQEPKNAFDSELSKDPNGRLPKRRRTVHDCDVCGTSYSEKRTLIRHLKTPAHCKAAGTSAVEHPCEYCSRRFTRRDLRQRHEKEVHFKIPRPSGVIRQPGVQISSITNCEYSPRSSLQSVRDLDDLFGTVATSRRSSTVSDVLTLWTPQTDTEVNEAVDPTNPYIAMAADQLGRPEGTYKYIEELPAPDIQQDDGRMASNVENQSLKLSTPSLTDDNASTLSVSTVSSARSRLEHAMHLPRSLLLYRGASLRNRSRKVPVRCMLCQRYLGSSLAEIRAHLDRHSKAYNEQYFCETCEMAFSHEQDYNHHINSVATGKCGFEFDHIEPCQGHHPPDIYSEWLSDNDRMRFATGVLRWEQAQLRTYLNQVNELIAGSRIDGESDCWSIGVVWRSMESLSNCFSRMSLLSAPDPAAYQAPISRRHLKRGMQKTWMTNIVEGMSWSSSLTKSLLRNELKPGNLAIAAENRELKSVEDMIDDGCDLNATYRLSDHTFSTPLQAAIMAHQHEIARKLIKSGANVGSTGLSISIGSTPLWEAVWHGEEQIVSRLLKSGANAAPAEGMSFDSIVCCAVDTGRWDIVMILLDHRANDGAVGMETLGRALESAVNCCDVEMMQLLLHYVPDVNILETGLRSDCFTLLATMARTPIVYHFDQRFETEQR